MEDFGYKKDESQSKLTDISKRGFLIGATLFSIACFVYVTINAYYFVYQDENSDIEVIKAEEGPIKVVEEKVEDAGSAMQIDRTIYEDIFGNKARRVETANPKIRHAPTPALPPKAEEVDRRLIKETGAIGEVKKEQKIVVYSDAAKKEEPSKDLLTKTSGEERTTVAKPVAPKSQKRAIRVQVAAMTSKAAADDTWKKLSKLYSGLFSGLKPFVEEADLGKRGIFYRLQIGNFFNQVEAEEFCEKYVAQTKKSRGDCIVVE
ncbi:MAG: SPOR domain-containing protein [Rickettsiales bacterium]|nr:SPOR domain-containing protein [Rickettsiales bacterium]